MSNPSTSSRPVIPPVASPAVGSLFGRYRIEKQLGEGAMGSVYLAHDTKLNDRPVALKVPKFTGDDRETDLQRFHREAGIAATLSHPNLCPIYDIGETDGVHYIAMGFIDGKPLNDVLGGKPAGEKQAALLARKIALAMQAAHEKGVVHRDLKPANIMMDARKEPVVMDFGLAKQAGGINEANLTQSGMILGTPAYMSPEQVNGDLEQIGPRSDIYSLGVILYELLTGQRPFQGPITAVLGQILTQEPPPPSQHRPNLDPRLEAIVLKAMAKSPGDRYSSMTELAGALADFVKQLTFGSSAAAAQVEKPHQPVDEISLGSVEALLDAARQCFQAHDYAEALRLLDTIPPKSRTEALESLRRQAAKRQEEVEDLQEEIAAAREQKKYRTLKPKLERLLKLKPGHAEAKRLMERLNTYGGEWKGLKFDDDTELPPSPRDVGLLSGMAVKYLAMIATAAIAFGVGLALIYPYLLPVSDTTVSSNVESSEQRSTKNGEPAAVSVANGMLPESDAEPDDSDSADSETESEQETPSSGLPAPSVVLTSPDWQWMKIKRMADKINTDAREYSAVLDQKERVLFFLRGVKPMFTRRRSKNGPFTEPKECPGPLGKLNQAVLSMSMTADSQVMVISLSSERPRRGQQIQASVWICQRDGLGRPFSEPVRMPDRINASEQMRTPWISHDGLMLLVSRPGPNGDSDLYQHTRQTRDEEFGPAMPLGPVANTEHADFGGTLSSDKLLLFRSTRDWDGEEGPAPKTVMCLRSSPDKPFEKLLPLDPVLDDMKPVGIHTSIDGTRIHFHALAPNGKPPNTDLYLAERVLKDPDAGK